MLTFSARPRSGGNRSPSDSSGSSKAIADPEIRCRASMTSRRQRRCRPTGGLPSRSTPPKVRGADGPCRRHTDPRDRMPILQAWDLVGPAGFRREDDCSAVVANAATANGPSAEARGSAPSASRPGARRLGGRDRRSRQLVGTPSRIATWSWRPACSRTPLEALVPWIAGEQRQPRYRSSRWTGSGSR